MAKWERINDKMNPACQEINSDSSSGSGRWLGPRSPGGSRTREKLDLERASGRIQARPALTSALARASETVEREKYAVGSVSSTPGACLLHF